MWGKKHSEITKKTISERNKGRPANRGSFKPGPRPDLRKRVTKSCYTCLKPFEIKRSHAGLTHCCSRKCGSLRRAKIMIGRKIHTNEFKQRLSERNYRGGVTEPNKLLRKSQDYKNWRRHVFQRDAYTCQACGTIGRQLHADHELPFSLFPDLRLEILNGRTLCVSCHRRTPTYAKSLDKIKALYI